MGWTVRLENEAGDAITTLPFVFSENGESKIKSQADVTVTYRYRQCFYKALDRKMGLRWLHEKTGEQCLPRITAAIGMLSKMMQERPDGRYLDPTPHDAKRVLILFAEWAELNPAAIWQFPEEVAKADLKEKAV